MKNKINSFINITGKKKEQTNTKTGYLDKCANIIKRTKELTQDCKDLITRANEYKSINNTAEYAATFSQLSNKINKTCINLQAINKNTYELFTKINKKSTEISGSMDKIKHLVGEGNKIHKQEINKIREEINKDIYIIDKLGEEANKIDLSSIEKEIVKLKTSNDKNFTKSKAPKPSQQNTKDVKSKVDDVTIEKRMNKRSKDVNSQNQITRL